MEESDGLSCICGKPVAVITDFRGIFKGTPWSLCVGCFLRCADAMAAVTPDDLALGASVEQE